MYLFRFPKPKDEGWFLVLGCVEDNELLALRRVGSFSRNRRSNQTLTFFTPQKTGRVIYTLFVMSDAYLGLDQQYDICLDVDDAEEEDDDDNEMNDDEIRFALLRQEKEKLEKRMKVESPRSEKEDFVHLGARPKTRKNM